MEKEVREEQPVSIPRSVQFAMTAHGGAGREYRISVAYPAEAPPDEGYPAVYVLDAGAVFATAVETVRLQARRGDLSGVAPSVVVGVGYPTDQPFPPARYEDFTMPAPPEELPSLRDGRLWPPMGGADMFASFLVDELMPEMERRYPLDRARRKLVGHSLGGLFVLHMLFTRPEAFRTYVAGSPSIHWNRGVLRERERFFAARVRAERLEADVLLAAGELEDGHPSGMNANAREQAERLASLAPFGVRAEYREFAGEGHLSVLPVLLSHAARFGS
ncbi:MAG: alpha/beta hydrolase [Paenibacillaceae bacterium]|nr:alpha/beta hydrolase [Paenibacillaceae bacterium]